MSQGRPTVVLTNDDGIGAPGIVALERAVQELGIGPYHVIAPTGPCSGCGHRVTTHEPIEFTTLDETHSAVSGTPADCVRMALHHLAPGVRLILSGINAGGNLGTDVFHSGTVAAVREGGLYGVPGIALSHYIARGRAIDWDRAGVLALRAIRELLERPWTPGTFWNVNLPHPAWAHAEPEITYCPVDPSPLPLNYRLEGTNAYYAGDYQKRARVDGTDVSVCFDGAIAVSSVGVVDPGLNVVDGPSHPRLIDAFNHSEDRKALRFHLADARSAMP